MEESLILLKEKFHLKETDANQYSPLVLAYLDDRCERGKYAGQ